MIDTPIERKFIEEACEAAEPDFTLKFDPAMNTWDVTLGVTLHQPSTLPADLHNLADRISAAWRRTLRNMTRTET